MYQKDFILFLIEQFARILGKIVARITGGQFDDARYEIDRVYRQVLGLNSELIGKFGYGYLMSMQRIDERHYADRCLVLAELLEVEGRLAYEAGDKALSFARYLKALNVFAALRTELPEKLAAYRERIDALTGHLERESLPGRTIPEATRALLAGGQERTDQIARPAGTAPVRPAQLPG